MYDRNINNRVLNFSVSGMLWNRSLVMEDVETHTLWSHLLGKGMHGKLEGAKLTAIPCDMLTWKAWLAAHPQTTVMKLKRTALGFNTKKYRKPKLFAFGWVEKSGDAYHTTLVGMQKSPLRNLKTGKSELLLIYSNNSTAARLFSRRVGSRTLSFEIANEDHIRDHETGSVWDPRTGKAIEGPLKGKSLIQRVGIMSYTRAWKIFHPESREIDPTI